VSPRDEGDDDSLEAWEREWDDPEELEELDDGPVPVDADGRPLHGPGSLGLVWQRAVARLIDVFITYTVAGFLAFLIVRPADGDNSILTVLTFGGVFWALAGVYEAGCVAWRGQTVGKMLLRLRIVRRTDGAKPSPGEAMVRYAVPTVWLLLPVPIIGQLMWMIVYLSSIPNARRQGWHDKAASTLVLVAG
jgi:uncharacterized RDD family membrane protein YckC